MSLVETRAVMSSDGATFFRQFDMVLCGMRTILDASDIVLLFPEITT